MVILDLVGMRWVLWEDALPPEAVLGDMLRFIRDGLRRREGGEGYEGGGPGCDQH